jgi:hypothetical protein
MSYYDRDVQTRDFRNIMLDLFQSNFQLKKFTWLSPRLVIQQR